MRSHLTLFAPLLWAIWALEASAWHDQGHMLVAAVAENQLDESEIETITNLLGSWDEIYPDMSSMEAAAVWPDHVKCNHHQPWCEGIAHYDNLQLFNTWHYVTLTYNPNDRHLKDLYKAAPWPQTGAVYALQQIWESLTGEAPHHVHQDPNQRPNRHNTAKHRHNSSVFSWNLQLRLLLHIVGDLHQPLHACEAFSAAFPDGDEGGTRVHLKGTGEHTSLHAFWDSGGGLLDHSWPRMKKSSVRDEAQELVDQFPKETFGERA
eukprot:Selendium_serpulae@DN5654_c0_g2_i1.p1